LFLEWLALQLECGGPSKGWWNIVRKTTASEEDAFTLFFELLDRFTNEQGIRPVPEQGPR